MVSSRSNSTGRSSIIIVIISSSINKISVLLTIFILFYLYLLYLYLLYHLLLYIFELFICFLLFYNNIPHHCFLRDHNGNKVIQLFCVFPAIAPCGEPFSTIFNFNEFVFVCIVNIRFMCDDEIYLLTY